MKTAEDFICATGTPPVRDDLDRANCPDAGKFGHWLCGWCEHDKPVQFCPECIRARIAAATPEERRNGGPLP